MKKPERVLLNFIKNYPKTLERIVELKGYTFSDNFFDYGTMCIAEINLFVKKEMYLIWKEI